MIRTVTVYTDVEVDVDLRRFSTAVLLEELEDRKDDEINQKVAEIKAKRDEEGIEEERCFYIPDLKSSNQHPLHGVYYALKFGKKEHAVDLMRDYLADLFGVVL
jgi:hypothetical protein